MATDALHQGLATGATGCIPTECQVRGDHLFYRAMHPYGMQGFAIGSDDCPRDLHATVLFGLVRDHIASLLREADVPQGHASLGRKAESSVLGKR